MSCVPTAGERRKRMETRTVAVSSEVVGALDDAIQAQVAAIQARGGTVLSVQLTPPLAATITSIDGEPPA